MKVAFERAVDDFFAIPFIKEKFATADLTINFEFAPHTRPKPLGNKIAVYGFFLGDKWLKIGHATYSARFTSQHYGTRRAGSTLAADIWRCVDEFEYEEQEDELDVWMLANLGRVNIIVPEKWGKPVLALLEHWLILRLEPRFEGNRG